MKAAIPECSSSMIPERSKMAFKVAWWMLALFKVVAAGVSCLSNPCYHGICIDDINSTYSCYCVDGYTGVQCQTNWDECWSDPCQNGGSCLDGIASYNCSCPEGFIGDNCETNYNECLSNPCLNNGTCIDMTNGYVCSCVPGFSGEHCDVDIAVCNTTEEVRCYNGGQCIEGPGFKFYCKCLPGWAGQKCDDQIDECESNPCQNGGVCIDVHADYMCACTFGYTGKSCEVQIEFCDENACSNDAICVVEDGVRVCYCVPDFHGERCELQYDECLLGPRCMNGGTCIDGVDNFTCSCPPKLTGALCDCLILDDGSFDCEYVSPTSWPTQSVLTTILFENSTTDIVTSTITGNDTIARTITTDDETETTTEVQTTTYMNTEVKEIETTVIVTEKAVTEEITNAAMDDKTETTTDLTTITIPPTVTEIDTEKTTEKVTEMDTTEITTEKITTLETTTEIQTTDKATEATSIQSVTDKMFTDTPTEHPTDSVTPSTFSSTEATEATIALGTETVTHGYTTSTVQSECTDSICNNHGTCVNSPNGIRCHCAFNYGGRFCEEKITISSAAFGGNSFIAHKLKNTTSIDIAFNAKTLLSDGQIMHVDIATGVYMQLYMSSGLLKFKFSCGYQTMLLSELKTFVNKGFPMQVETRLDLYPAEQHCNATLRLNDTVAMSGGQIANISALDHNTTLYLGNSPDLKDAEIKPFIGCIKNLMVNGVDIEVFGEAVQASEVVECVSLACLSAPCLNGGTCADNDGNYTCSCSNGLKNRTPPSPPVDVVKGRLRDNKPGAEEMGSSIYLSTYHHTAITKPPAKHGDFYINGGTGGAKQTFNQTARQMIGVVTFNYMPRWTGAHCDHSVCEHNPCQSGGSCVRHPGSGFLCLCPYGTHGIFCEYNVEITRPSLSPISTGVSSYLVYPLSPGAINSDRFDLRLRFQTADMEQIALLAFIGQNGRHGPRSQHMALTFVKGYIMLTWNMGSGPRRIFTSRALSARRGGHSLRLWRRGRTAGINVDGRLNVTGNAPSATNDKMTLMPYLYIGGHPSEGFRNLPHDLPLHNGWRGCVWEVGGQATGGRAAGGRGVGQCGVQQCTAKSCNAPRGVCIHSPATYGCICNEGWFGPTCSHARNPCDVGVSKCRGQCVIMSEADARCDCPYGKTGADCDQELLPTDVLFTGTRSYIKLHPRLISSVSLSLEAEIKPTKERGLVVFAETPHFYTALSMQGGLLEYRWTDRLSGVTSLVRSGVVLSMSQWHSVKAGRYGSRLYVWVDSALSTEAMLAHAYPHTSSNATILLGGAKDMSTLPFDAMSGPPESYTGCIRNLHVNNILIVLEQHNIQEGQNVDDCDGTACGGETCSGGSCTVEGGRARCSCAGGAAGGPGGRCRRHATCSPALCAPPRGRCREGSCICATGFAGLNCEQTINITIPQFVGNSLLSLTPRRSGDGYKLAGEQRAASLPSYVALNFTTAQQDALLLWADMDADYIGVGLENGFLRLVWSFRRYNSTMSTHSVKVPESSRVLSRLVPSAGFLADGEWHTLVLRLEKHNISLLVDKAVAYVEEPGLHAASHYDDMNLYIGGILEESEAARHIFPHKFKGCIDHISTSEQTLLTNYSQVYSENVKSCQLFPPT